MKTEERLEMKVAIGISGRKVVLKIRKGIFVAADSRMIRARVCEKFTTDSLRLQFAQFAEFGRPLRP